MDALWHQPLDSRRRSPKTPNAPTMLLCTGKESFGEFNFQHNWPYSSLLNASKMVCSLCLLWAALLTVSVLLAGMTERPEERRQGKNRPEIVWKKDRIRVNQKEVEKAERSRECVSEGPSEGQCCHQWSVTSVLEPIHHSLKEITLQSSVHHSSHQHQTLPNTAISASQTHTTCHSGAANTQKDKQNTYLAKTSWGMYSSWTDKVLFLLIFCLLNKT